MTVERYEFPGLSSIDVDADYGPDKGDIEPVYSRRLRRWVGVKRLQSRPRIDVREYDGANIAAKINAALVDQAARREGDIEVPDGTHRVDEPIVLQSDTGLYGSGRYFLGCQFQTSGGDHPIFETTDAAGTTRITLGNFVVLPTNNITTAAIDLYEVYILDWYSLFVDPSAAGTTPRKFLKLRDCDSIRFFSPWFFGQRGTSGNKDYGIDSDSTVTRCDIFGGNIEATGSGNHVIVRLHGFTLHGTQFERAIVIVDSLCALRDFDASDSTVVVHPNAVEWAIENGRFVEHLSILSPWGSVRNTRSIGTLAPKAIDFTPGIYGSAAQPTRVPVTATNDYLICVQHVGVATTANNTAASSVWPVNSGTAQPRVAWRESVTIPDAIYSTGLGYPTSGTAGTEAACAVHFARALTSATELEVGGPGVPMIKAYASLLTKGTFRSDAGAFDATGWTTNDCTIAEVAPDHTSQNYTHAGTFTSSGTAVTGSGTAFNTALRAGDWLYSSSNAEWRQIASIASATALTLGAAFTSDVASGEDVDVGPSWAELQAANATYAIYQDLSLHHGKTYLAIARVKLYGDTQLNIAHGSPWNGSTDLRPVFSTTEASMPVVQDGNQAGKTFDAPTRYPDGSGLLSILFTPTLRQSSANRVGLGAIAIDGTNYARVLGMAVVEVP